MTTGIAAALVSRLFLMEKTVPSLQRVFELVPKSRIYCTGLLELQLSVVNSDPAVAWLQGEQVNF